MAWDPWAGRPAAGSPAFGPPEHMLEVPVFEHPADVQVGPGQQLVERLEIIRSNGDIQVLDVPAEPGEPFDEARFAARRLSALRALAGGTGAWGGAGAGSGGPADGEPDPGPLDGGEESLPSVLSRHYALWMPKGPEAGGGRAGALRDGLAGAGRRFLRRFKGG